MTSIKEDKILFYGIKTTRNSNKLVQLKLLNDIKNKLDKIFSTNDITALQVLKMIATKLLTIFFCSFLLLIMSNTQNQSVVDFLYKNLLTNIINIKMMIHITKKNIES